jgi:hypothetical protein
MRDIVEKSVASDLMRRVMIRQVIMMITSVAVVVISVGEEISRWFDTTKNRGRVGLAGRPSLRGSSLQVLELVTSGASRDGMPPLPF